MAAHKQNAPDGLRLEAVTNEKSQAQRAGFIVNVTRLKLTGSDGDYSEEQKHRVWILSNDDGSSCPYFKSEDGAVECLCAYIRDMSIIEEVAPVPAVPQLPTMPPAPVAPALTLDKEPLPVAYTELQQLAINTFQGMYDAALRHREGLDSRLNGDYGICDNIDRFSDMAGANSSQMSEVKENLIRVTPIYSGNYTYPVPCPTGGDASNAFSRHSNKWREAYGLNRLTQLGQLIDIIKSDKWSDDMVKRKTPAFRNGLVVGDIVRYTRRDVPSFWVFRRDDESMSPSFHKLLDKDDYTDIDLNYIVKVDRESVFKVRSVSEFLSTIAEQVAKKADIERQIAELQSQLQSVQSEVAMLDFGLADQHKVKRI